MRSIAFWAINLTAKRTTGPKPPPAPRQDSFRPPLRLSAAYAVSTPSAQGAASEKAPHAWTPPAATSASPSDTTRCFTRRCGGSAPACSLRCSSSGKISSLCPAFHKDSQSQGQAATWLGPQGRQGRPLPCQKPSWGLQAHCARPNPRALPPPSPPIPALCLPGLGRATAFRLALGPHNYPCWQGQRTQGDGRCGWGPTKLWASDSRLIVLLCSALYTAREPLPGGLGTQEAPRGPGPAIPNAKPQCLDHSHRPHHGWAAQFRHCA